MNYARNDTPTCANIFIYTRYTTPKKQSQFRFDNECYLNLPENHKRVSAAATTAVYNNSISAAATAWHHDSLDASLAALHTTDGAAGGGGGDAGDVVELGATGSSVAGGPLGKDASVVAAASTTAAAAAAPGTPSIASDEFDFASVSMFSFIIYLFCC